MIDLSKCKKGDILISSHGAELVYIAPTPWEEYTYLDHVVMYTKLDGKRSRPNNYGTRTNDGFVFAKNREPEIDHDIVKIIKNDENETLLQELKNIVIKQHRSRANSVVLIEGTNSYTGNQIADEIEKESKFGRDVISKLLRLTLDLLSRNKEELPK